MKATKHHKTKEVSIKLDFLGLEQLKAGFVEWEKFYNEQANKYMEINDIQGYNIEKRKALDLADKIAQVDELSKWIINK